ncbi:EthD domain-domain-containing protein [Microdochium bolleyi]|uniref:EthD domain-domain-containing protein n=1 Tax=Microdochium bolleyi TaxID=196109 RepID=A0A136ISI4_9PEZI|nr:EthD domain-domain-containing protein [Microdochium bolleyi]
MSTEKLIRITTLIPRKKGMSQDDFYKHWATVHGPMVIDFMMRHGVVEYRQYHTTPETKALGEAMAKAMGRPLLEFDGISDAYVRDFVAFQEAFKDPEYTDKIQPDELAFIDVENLQMTIGYDYWVLENGKPVTEHARTFT